MHYLCRLFPARKNWGILDTKCHLFALLVSPGVLLCCIDVYEAYCVAVSVIAGLLVKSQAAKIGLT